MEYKDDLFRITCIKSHLKLGETNLEDLNCKFKIYRPVC